MFSLVSEGVRKEYRHIRRGMKDLSSDVIPGIGAILSLVTVIAALAVFVILIVSFSTSGGFGSITSDITHIGGNASGFYDTPALAVLGGLNISLLIMSFILFFRNEGALMRVLGGISLITLIGSFTTLAVMIHMDEQGKIKDPERLKTLFYGLLIAVLVSSVVSFVLTLVREKEMAGSCLRLTIFSFGLLPLLTLCIENILALIVGAVGVFILGAVLSGDSSSSSSAGSEAVSPRRAVPTKPEAKTVSDSDKRNAIYDINKRYKDGCTAIVRRNGEIGAFMFSDKTNYEIAQLRKSLEREAELRGVKGKVSIY